MMLSCPHKGCGGFLDEWCCTGCGKVTTLKSLLGHYPPTERVRLEQERREDFAVREA